MSAVTEFEPVFEIPERARRASSALARAQECWAEPQWEVEPDERPAAQIVRLHKPSRGSVAAPIRLTRRGVVVLGLAVTFACLALLGIAKLSAPSAANPPAGPAVPANVSVQPGDTLWSIAARIAPQTDPRAEVATLVRLNHLDSAALVPGQLIRTR